MLIRYMYEASHEGPTRIIGAMIDCLMTFGMIVLEVKGQVEVSESTIPPTEATTSAFCSLVFMCQCHNPNVSCKATAYTYIFL